VYIPSATLDETLNSETKLRVRLDRWLWAARFCKTRAIAKAVVTGGKVHVNGVRARPSRAISIGDRMTITNGEVQFEIVVSGLSTRRGPAATAVSLYEESEQSISRREELRTQKNLERSKLSQRVGRPDKHARRKIIRFTRKRET
jgi:ribosome-associated heat shock protein Hsp15